MRFHGPDCIIAGYISAIGAGPRMSLGYRVRGLMAAVVELVARIFGSAALPLCARSYVTWRAPVP